MLSVLLVLFCLLSPLLVLWLTHRFPFCRKVGSVVLAYAVGCILGLSGLLPQQGPEAESVHKVLTIVASASVPLAIPLMLFPSDVRSWRRLAPNFVKSLFMGIVACMTMAVLGYCLFGSSDPDKYARVSAMFVGLYTGGTTNMATIKEILSVDESTFLLASAYNILVGALYLLLIIIGGKHIAGLFLPPFKGEKELSSSLSPSSKTSSCAPSSASISVADEDKVEKVDKKVIDCCDDEEDSDGQLFMGLFLKKYRADLVRAFGLTLLILAAGAGLTLLFPKDAFMAVFMLTISLLAILASLNKRVGSLRRTFEAGVYLILVFGVAVSSQVGLGMFTNLDLHFFLYVTVVSIGPLLAHILLNALLRVDVDTTLVSSIALTTSPAFVPVMAGALKNRAIVGPGITVGLIGYAVGSYLGYLVYLLLSSGFFASLFA